ncbi:MAG: methyltransferase domain-containing protein [Methanomicrobiales archaeon]|nr:methyltransferase domain-containing protein [Methanomicrobiales archaeon]
MEYQDIEEIAQGSLAIMNPTTIGDVCAAAGPAALSAGDHVLDMGAGNGTVLAALGRQYGICGTGIERRRSSCRLAEAAFLDQGLSERLRIICADAAAMAPGTPADMVVCLGASSIWGGIPHTLAACAPLLRTGGHLLLGDRYWRHERVQPEFAREWPDVLTEYELLSVFGETGYELCGITRSSERDWDRYESSIWQSCRAWIAAHPGDPRTQEVEHYLRDIQAEYLGYGREHVGWAMYLLSYEAGAAP